MTFPRIGARRVTGHEAVVNVTPMVRANVHRIDADLLHCIDRLQHALDLRPAGLAQVNLSARPHKRHRRKSFAAFHRPQYVDAREDGAKVVGSPSNERKNAAWRKAQDTPAAVKYLLGDVVAEADPLLDLLLAPDKFDMGKRVRMRYGCNQDAALSTRSDRTPPGQIHYSPEQYHR